MSLSIPNSSPATTRAQIQQHIGNNEPNHPFNASNSSSNISPVIESVPYNNSSRNSQELSTSDSSSSNKRAHSRHRRRCPLLLRPRQGMKRRRRPERPPWWYYYLSALSLLPKWRPTTRPRRIRNNFSSNSNDDDNNSDDDDDSSYLTTDRQWRISTVLTDDSCSSRSHSLCGARENHNNQNNNNNMGTILPLLQHSHDFHNNENDHDTQTTPFTRSRNYERQNCFVEGSFYMKKRTRKWPITRIGNNNDDNDCEGAHFWPSSSSLLPIQRQENATKWIQESVHQQPQQQQQSPHPPPWRRQEEKMYPSNSDLSRTVATAQQPSLWDTLSWNGTQRNRWSLLVAPPTSFSSFPRGEGFRAMEQVSSPNPYVPNTRTKLQSSSSSSLPPFERHSLSSSSSSSWWHETVSETWNRRHRTIQKRLWRQRQVRFNLRRNRTIDNPLFLYPEDRPRLWYNSEDVYQMIHLYHCHATLIYFLEDLLEDDDDDEDDEKTHLAVDRLVDLTRLCEFTSLPVEVERESVSRQQQERLVLGVD